MPVKDSIGFRRKIQNCPVLGSLKRVNDALADLTRSSDCHAFQVAEIIRKDPSLTTRLLRLVNSVYSGLREPVTDLETAVFYLGLKGIRQLSFSTQLIEDLSRLPGISERLDWRQLWKHCIATGYLSREVLSLHGSSSTSDLDYLVGLLHDVGKIVMAYAFPAEFEETLGWSAEDTASFAKMEKAAFGWDHTEVGSEYLRMHGLGEEIVTAVRWHNEPVRAGSYFNYAAAVQIAQSLTCYSGIGSGVEKVHVVATNAWMHLDGWKLLFPDEDGNNLLSRALLQSSMERMPSALAGMA